MKILTITDAFGTGGKERRLIELLKGLRKENIACELIVLSDVVQYEELYTLDIDIHFLKRKYAKDPGIYWDLIRIIRQSKADIIQSWSSMASVYLLPIVPFVKAKFVNAIIADAPKNVSSSGNASVRKRLTFPFSDAIISNSYAGLQAYNAPKNRSVAIHNGFDFKRVNDLSEPEQVRNRFNITTPFVVGMVGKFEDRKDYDTYLKAATLVLESRRDVTFLAIGDGKNLEQIRLLVKEEDKQQILFTGRQTGVESIINIFSIGVLASNDRIHGEGISNAILEYMVLGKPVVATRGGGTAEIVIDGETGYIVEPFNPQDMASQLLHLLSNDTEREAMGKRSASLIRQEFSLEKMTDSYIKLYNALLDKRPIQELEF
ncbi:MAG: glycosyltransferase [Bacteroidota bacterium]